MSSAKPKSGILVDAELVDLLTISQRYAESTHGLFGPAVQPLWRLYMDHFSRSRAAPKGPPRPAGYTVASVDRR
jgi:thiamine biosynthesis lipoprotein